MKLVKPSVTYKESYLSALEEASHEKLESFLAAPKDNQTFKDFVNYINDHANGKNLPDGYVPATTFWITDGNKIIGRIQLRHILNDYLKQYGGHIGYYIRPSERRKGYATKALKEVLKYAQEMGLDKVLLTCDEDNIGSNKVIQSCGGILEDTVDVAEGKPRKNRYWISLI